MSEHRFNISLKLKIIYFQTHTIMNHEARRMFNNSDTTQ